MPDKAAALPLWNISIDALPVNIPHEKAPGPFTKRALHDRQARVGMTATR